MPIMKDKFVKDYFEAVEIDKMITRQQISIDEGVHILNNMIKYVREDIKTLDKEVFSNLCALTKKLEGVGEERKKDIFNQFPKPEDTIEKREFEMRLLREDHEKLKKELFLIQDIAYRQGWFE